MSQELFGPYRLGKFLGGGTLGEVHAASWSDATPRPEWLPKGELALKRLFREHLGDPSLCERFAAECTLARRLSHPRLAAAFDSGSVGGVPYLAMLRIDGRALSTAGAPLPRRRLSALPSELGAALGYLHSLGLVHGDVSPANIVVGAGGATLVDFSTATFIGERHVPPRGTFAYMSPEQVMGLPLGVASDQFSLAVVLWEELSERRLFQREGQHLTLTAVVEDHVPLNPALGGAAAVLGRALEKDPQRRFASIAAFASSLTRSLEAERGLQT